MDYQTLKSLNVLSYWVIGGGARAARLGSELANEAATVVVLDDETTHDHRRSSRSRIVGDAGAVHVIGARGNHGLLRQQPVNVSVEWGAHLGLVTRQSHIDAWITAAVRRRVEELHVRRHGGLLEYVLPSCVFNCETLIELHIFMSHEMRLPALVCLKNLKVLTLACVDFGGDSSVEKLLSCPSLEELSLIACKWRRLKVLHISAPKLLRLDIVEDSFYKNLENTFYVGVHGARIESFSYSGQFIDRYTISSSSSLVVARIDMFICERPHHHVTYHGYKLLKDLSCVKRLIVHNVGEGIHAEPETVDAIFNPTPRCFVSSLKVIKINRFQVGDKALLAIRNVLRTVGVLEKLFIHPPWGKQLPESLLPLLREP
ncbi:hypothetical protein NL676_005751 [Syzygium grande]|nr:hypothetical protein NL676_005751 [Syzygium grande]